MNNMPALDLWGSLLAKLWLLLDTLQTALVMERQASICSELTLIPRLKVKRETMWNAKTWWPNSLLTGCFQLSVSALLCASHGLFLHTSLFSSFVPRKRSYLDFLSSVMISYLFINVHPWNKRMGMMVSAMHLNSWPRVCAAASGVQLALASKTFRWWATGAGRAIPHCLHPQNHPASSSFCTGAFSPQSCDYEMSPWKQLEYNMFLLAFPHPPSPPTNLLTFWSYVCCARKTLPVPLLPIQTCKGDCVHLTVTPLPKNIPIH